MPNKQQQNSLESILSALRDDYLADSPTRFSEMENQILALEDTALFENQYSALFRNVHSIKGSAGTHGLFILSRICHRLEDHLVSYKQFTSLSHNQTSHLLKFIDLLVLAQEQVVNGIDVFTSIEQQLDDLDITESKKIIKILISGQSISTINIISQILKKYPVQIVTSQDGLQSLDKLVHNKFDLLFVGMELAILNGSALIAAIRMSKSINSKLPVIVLTSKARLEVEAFLAVDYVIQRDSNLVTQVEQALKKVLHI